MPDRPVRVHLVADSHLGFDHPARPRVHRRRRGLDFLANHEQALLAALAPPRADLVVHGGDLFHRPDVAASLVHQAFEPLKRLADEGVPVFVVPGNHERSRIPFDWLTRHPRIHVFGRPHTHVVAAGPVTVAVSGIPSVRYEARTRFPEMVARTGWADAAAGVRLLCTHQAFEGATVGPADFTFRRSHDVLRHRDVPCAFAAVLSGHIHRHQVLDHDLAGRPVAAPVFYPGSVERTAFAEAGETKGYLRVDVSPDAGGGRVSGWTFHPLYARPMRTRSLEATGASPGRLEADLRSLLAAEPADAVLRIRVDGVPRPGARRVLGAENVRRLAPDSMNVEVVVPGEPRSFQRHRRTAGARRASTDPAVLELGL